MPPHSTARSCGCDTCIWLIHTDHYRHWKPLVLHLVRWLDAQRAIARPELLSEENANLSALDENKFQLYNTERR
jgi:hypothetical protein